MSSKDQAQRNTALDVSRSFIVQAPAGSGKTELLTQRFLKLLTTVDKPERVLAITFTRKATQEMRQRILGRIRQAAPGMTQEVAGHERTAVALAAAVCQKDKELGWQLLRNPTRLQIHTIDGLCARIAGMLPSPGEGLPGMRVMEDAQPLYQKAARRLIEDIGSRKLADFAYASLTRLLVLLQGDADRLGAMLVAMLARRDQWLMLISEREANPGKVLQKRQGEELACLKAVLGADALDVLTASLLSLAKGADDVQQAGELQFTLRAIGSEPHNIDLQVKALWLALSAVATKKSEPYAPGSLNKYVLAGGGRTQRAACIERLKPIVQAWRDDEIASLVFQRFTKTPPLGLSVEQGGILEDCIVLLRVADLELRHLFSEENRSDFQYMAEMAMNTLGPEDQPGDALLYADYRLTHILMDEFQDTSHMQHRLLRRLTSGWQNGDGRTLFLVGDPMQSIYRFRKADVSLFKQVFKQAQWGDIDLVPLHLSSNFRSRMEIIDWVNSQFQTIFKQRVAVSPGAVAYTSVDAERGKRGHVLAHPWPHAMGEAHEAVLVADLIEARQSQRDDTSIAVLARGRAHLTAIARELKVRGIGCEAVQVEKLASRPVIHDLLAIMRAILHPLDRIAWLALLRAPWVGLTPAQLHTFSGKDGQQDMLKLISAADKLSGVEESLMQRLKGLGRVMGEVIAARGRVPLHRLVEVAWIRLKGPYVIGSQPELDNAQDFFRLLAGIEAERPEDINTTIIQRMDKFYSGSSASTVKLMTIHGAKGLEFDVVILPGLQRRAGRGDQVFVRTEELQFDDTSHGVLMAPVKGREEDAPNLYNYLEALNVEQEAFEAQRVLYVAATRAREELHLFGGWKMMGPAGNKAPGSTKGTFMQLLWPFFEAAIDLEDDTDGAADGATASSAEPPVLPFLRLQNEPPLAIEPLTPELDRHAFEMKIPDQDRLAFGDAVHLWLELLHEHPPEKWSAGWLVEHRAALQASLANAGARETHIEDLCQRLEKMLDEIMSSKKGRGIVLAKDKNASWAELPFYTRDGVRLRKHIIDRMYQLDDGSYVIIDYKTGQESESTREKWKAQLERYRSIVEGCTGAEVERELILQLETGAVIRGEAL